MHLKNFSLLTDEKGIHRLTPAYDLLNSTIALAAPEEELALSMAGKKKGFTKMDFIEFARGALSIDEIRATKEIEFLFNCESNWKEMIEKSFLSPKMKKAYVDVLNERISRLSARGKVRTVKRHKIKTKSKRGSLKKIRER